MNYKIIGGGPAGCEAAWQLLKKGHKVELFEMRPKKMTEAHKTKHLAELVCSNSFKSTKPGTASAALKYEMNNFDSLVLQCAEQTKVPAGHSLAVDREKFSKLVESRLNSHPNFKRTNKEITNLASEQDLAKNNERWIVATGPLTSSALGAAINNLLESGGENLYFYDAIAPIVAAETINMEHAFFAERYQKDLSVAGDYLNIPLNKEEYDTFITEIKNADYMPLADFETTKYFESCLPIEVMIERGEQTLRFGPLKPVGLTNPQKKLEKYYAVIQLRKENSTGTMFSMVGFQTKMKYPEQKRIFSSLKALENSEFLRFGSIHRNTYLNSPNVLNIDLSFKKNKNIYLAGQITGVEGYLESAAMGILAGISALNNGGATQKRDLPPNSTMMGALLCYVTSGGLSKFQPMNANLGILPALNRVRKESKPERKLRHCKNAQENFDKYFY